MAESFGTIPFSVGGTNASGYSLVAAFSLYANSSGNEYSIAQEDYDFGIVVSGVYEDLLLVTPQFFTNITGITRLYHYASASNFVTTTRITVSSSGIMLSTGSPSFYASVSIAVFKFS